MVLRVRRLLGLALVASAAVAQTGPAPLGRQTGSGKPESPATASWSESIRETFFTDGTTMTLRPEADIRAKWSALSPESQRLVRQDCAATRAGSIGGATSADAAGPAPAEPIAGDPPPPMSSDATGPAGSAVAAGDISLSHLVQICGFVDEV